MKMPSQRQITLLAYVPGPNETPQPSCEIFAAHLMAWELRGGNGPLPYKPNGVVGVLVSLRNQGLVTSSWSQWGSPRSPFYDDGGWDLGMGPGWRHLWQRTFEI